MSDFLQAEHLCKSYLSGPERLEILSDLSLQVQQGDSLAIVGESGSGKTTLLHLLGGMDRPDSGEVRFEGTNIYGWEAERLAQFRNHKLGFVFQFHHLLPEFTAVENVAFPKLIAGSSQSEALRQAGELLEEVGLGRRAHHRPGELSGGEQQRVALARALVSGPKLLLADEPTGNLDPRTAESIEVLLFRLHVGRGLTTVLVTHSERLAARCSRIWRLEQGRLHPLGIYRRDAENTGGSTTQ